MTRVFCYMGVGAVLAAAGLSWSASAQQSVRADSAPALGSRELVTHFQPADNGPTTLTLVDPQTRVMAVYHVVRESGEIQLKSVRNFNGDLSLEEFNTASPSPRDIRQMTELKK